MLSSHRTFVARRIGSPSPKKNNKKNNRGGGLTCGILGRDALASFDWPVAGFPIRASFFLFDLMCLLLFWNSRRLWRDAENGTPGMPLLPPPLACSLSRLPARSTDDVCAHRERHAPSEAACRARAQPTHARRLSYVSCVAGTYTNL